MIDTTMSQAHLSVSASVVDWPYFIIPLTHLDKVQALLDANQVSYWVDAEALSFEWETRGHVY